MNWGRDITRAEIVAAARSWIGVPYRHLGRSRKYVDCIGFIWVVPLEMNLPGVPVIPNKYSQYPSADMLIRECDEKLIKAPEQGTDKLRAGDIMVLWGWERNTPQHFAIVGTDGPRLTMIHAFAKRGMVVEHGIDDFWTARYVATYNYPGTVD